MRQAYYWILRDLPIVGARERRGCWRQQGRAAVAIKGGRSPHFIPNRDPRLRGNFSLDSATCGTERSKVGCTLFANTVSDQTRLIFSLFSVSVSDAEVLRRFLRVAHLLRNPLWDHRARYCGKLLRNERKCVRSTFCLALLLSVQYFNNSNPE